MARTKPTRIVTRSSVTLTRSRARKKEQTPAAAFLSSTRDSKPKSKTAPSRKKTPKKKLTKPKLYAVGKKASTHANRYRIDKAAAQVRVWWPPTRNKKRTDFSGAYWPAKVVDSYEGGYRVEYDNGEREDVDGEDVSPATPPVAFGGETMALAVRKGSARESEGWL